MSGWLSASALLFEDANLLVTILVGSAIKGSLLLFATLALLRARRRLSASVRHLTIALAFWVVVMLPALSLFLPAWNVALLDTPSVEAVWGEYRWTPNVQSFADRSVLPPASVPRNLLPASGATGVGAAGSPERTRREDRENALAPAKLGKTVEPAWAESGGFWGGWPRYAALLWLAGLGFILLRLLFGSILVQREIHRSGPLEDPSWKSILDELAASLGVTRAVRLLENSRLEVALSVGIWRPAVLLPKVAGTWSPARKRSILLHELAHIKRWDNLVNLLAQIGCAVYWFNPLIWWSSRQLLVERERACDDEVLLAGTKPSDYASHLLALARAISTRRFWGQLEVSQASALKDRLMAVLDPLRSRSAPSLTSKVVAVVAGVCLAGPLAALQPWTEPSNTVAATNSIRGADLGPLRRLAQRDPVKKWKAGTAGERLRKPSTGRNVLSSVLVAANTTSWDSGTALQRVQLLQDNSDVSHVLSVGLRREKSSTEGWRPLGETRQTGARHSVQQHSASVAARLQASSRASYSPVHPWSPGSGSGSGGNSNQGPGPGNPSLKVEVRRLELGTLGGTESRAAAINDGGQVVGESQTETGIHHPFLWTAELGMLDLTGSLPVHARAAKINQAGQVLCETFNTWLFKGFLWSPDLGLSDIGAFDESFPLTISNDLNEEGVVVGASRNKSGTLRAFAWSPDLGMVDLGAPGWSEALAVNESGQVVGYGNDHAFLWSPDSGLQLITPTDVEFAVATDVNSSGQVVGYAEFPDGATRAFLWTEENGHVDLGTFDPAYPYTLALGINNLGQIVGQAVSDPETGPVQVRAFRWTAQTGMQDLGRTVLSAEDGRVPDSDLAINAIGQIIGIYGDAVLESGVAEIFLWMDGMRVSLTSEDDLDSNPEAVAANNKNQVVGSRLSPGNRRVATLWELTVKEVSAQGVEDDRE